MYPSLHSISLFLTSPEPTDPKSLVFSEGTALLMVHGSSEAQGKFLDNLIEQFIYNRANQTQQVPIIPVTQVDGLLLAGSTAAGF